MPLFRDTKLRSVDMLCYSVVTYPSAGAAEVCMQVAADTDSFVVSLTTPLIVSVFKAYFNTPTYIPIKKSQEIGS